MWVCESQHMLDFSWLAPWGKSVPRVLTRLPHPDQFNNSLLLRLPADHPGQLKLLLWFITIEELMARGDQVQGVDREWRVYLEERYGV